MTHLLGDVVALGVPALSLSPVPRGAHDAVADRTMIPTVTEQDLKDAFEAFGAVQSAAIIKDKFSGESRGFGFVETPNGVA
jgi:RNA recognition motif-containing protein